MWSNSVLPVCSDSLLPVPPCRFVANFLVASPDHVDDVKSGSRVDAILDAELLRLGYGSDVTRARNQNLHNLDVTGVVVTRPPRSEKE